MNYKEIASKITGFSCPIFGISWNPPKSEIELARRIITFFEDRRVLYNPYELEMPKHCEQSIIEIRQFLTEQLFDINNDSELGKIVRAMRSACRKFLDTIQKEYIQRELERTMGMPLSIGLAMDFIAA